jgi:hypothetical protein
VQEILDKRSACLRDKSTKQRACLAGHGFGSEADSSHFGKSVEIHQLKRFMPHGHGMIASMAA